jgi:serine/threonine protein kinase
MDPDRTTLTMPAGPVRARADGGWTLAGRYRIEGVIGQGGMSTVYRATDTTLDREVAVKVLLPALAESDPTHITRFEREARAVAALRHPAVVKIYDTGRDGETRFIVMEYVTGRGLNELLADGQPLAPDQAARIAAQVAGALAAAHAAGILHRDVKPANVMIGPGGEVKILDFGIARSRHDLTLTQPAFAIGTAAYMSPERVVGRAGDERSDIYSLGCLLYAMLTGRPPFLADDVLAVLHQQAHAPPVPPSQLGADIAPALEALVLAMLAKDPAARPQTASEVASRLADRGTQPVEPSYTKVSTSGRRVLAAGGSGGSGGAKRASRPVRADAGLTRAALAGAARANRAADAQAGQLVAAFADALPISTPAAAPTPAPAPAKPKPKPAPPAHGGVPPGHAPGGPPGHQGKPPKGPKPPKGHGGH